MKRVQEVRKMAATYNPDTDWMKLGDIRLSDLVSKGGGLYPIVYLMDDSSSAHFTNAFLGAYRFRYLASKDDEQLNHRIIGDVSHKVAEELKKLVTMYPEYSADFFKASLGANTASEDTSTSDGTVNATGDFSNRSSMTYSPQETTTTSDTGTINDVNGQNFNNTDTDTLNGTDTVTTTTIDKSKYIDVNEHIGKGTHKTTYNSLTTTNDSNKTIDTRHLKTANDINKNVTNEKTGVQTVNEVPSAQVTTKTITMDVQTPLASTKSLTDVGTTLDSDIVDAHTPFEIAVDSSGGRATTSVNETVNFASLNRDSNGNYTHNVTTTTYGTTDDAGTLIPLKESVTESTADEDKLDGHTQLTETWVVDGSGSKPTDEDGNLLITDNNTQGHSGYDELEDEYKGDVTDSAGKSWKGLVDKRTIEHQDEKDKNFKQDIAKTDYGKKSTLKHTGNITTTNVRTLGTTQTVEWTGQDDTESDSSGNTKNDTVSHSESSATGNINETGFRGDRSLMAINFLELLKKQVVTLEWFLAHYKDCFQPCYNLDDREWYDCKYPYGSVVT